MLAARTERRNEKSCKPERVNGFDHPHALSVGSLLVRFDLPITPRRMTGRNASHIRAPACLAIRDARAYTYKKRNVVVHAYPMTQAVSSGECWSLSAYL